MDSPRTDPRTSALWEMLFMSPSADSFLEARPTAELAPFDVFIREMAKRRTEAIKPK